MHDHRIEKLSPFLLWFSHIELGFGLDDQKLCFQPFLLPLSQKEVLAQLLLFSIVSCNDHAYEQIQDEEGADNDISNEEER